MNQATTFIYGLLDPRTQQLRYVGKSNNPTDRLKGHISEAKSISKTHKSRWLRKLLNDSIFPELVILEEVSLCDFQAAEKWWIAYARSLGCLLVNGTDGGDCGKEFELEVRAKISKALKGRPKSEEHRINFGLSMKGRTLSEAHKEKIGASWYKKSELERKLIQFRKSLKMRGEGNPMYGKTHSPEILLKIKESRKDYEVSDATKLKLSAIFSGEGNPMFGRTHSPEARIKISEARLGKPGNAAFTGHTHSDETKHRMSESKKGKKFTSEHKAKIAAARKAAWDKKLEETGSRATGRKHTQEELDKMRRRSRQCKEVLINGAS